MKDRLIVDIDKDEKIVGIEVLNASFQIPKKEINIIQRTPLFTRV